MPQITLNLSLPETNLILEALGAMPYARVYELVNAIHRQAEAQLATDGDAPAWRDSRLSHASTEGAA
ncbi:hypothetical protein ACIBHX_51960 [Nonomuraea sp. NPDC050536]|uniref:hypothetical protein n=1 Tax=Nonomuraea sp. NPDC050536 TaxID=3364366 RepID=UPI0037C6F2E3